LTTFLKRIQQKQRQLSKFLCRVKEESEDRIFEIVPTEFNEIVKSETDVDPIALEEVVVKTEWLENDLLPEISTE
jgi:hypothetical protein